MLIQLRRCLDEKFGCGLSMLDMFRHTTVAALAERLGRGAAPALPALQNTQREAGKERLRRRLERRLPQAGDEERT
jgi:hypothetical protein